MKMIPGMGKLVDMMGSTDMDPESDLKPDRRHHQFDDPPSVKTRISSISAARRIRAGSAVDVRRPQAAQDFEHGWHDEEHGQHGAARPVQGRAADGKRRHVRPECEPAGAKQRSKRGPEDIARGFLEEEKKKK